MEQNQEKSRKLPNWVVETIVMLIVAALLYGMLWFDTSINTQQLKDNIQLINPPQEVLAGRVLNMTVTTVSSGNTETKTLVVKLCSGQTWTVPNAQVDTVEQWLKSGLAPHYGCN